MKIRKVFFLEESFSFLKELQRSGVLVNLLLRAVFRGSRSENLDLAMDLLTGKKKLEVQIREAGDSTSRVRSHQAVKQEKIKVKLTQKRDDGKKKKGLLAELSDMAREFD